mmetsp:Transcript_99790/g.197981  ORF Transcript_99790/g.197981 Transcript_99790/m.197981 type:complete len:163 (-) Transcript_99790:37-525(-)
MSLTSVFDDEAECLFREDYAAYVRDQLLLLQGGSCSQVDPIQAKEDWFPIKSRFSSISMASMSTTEEGSIDDELLASNRPSTDSNLSSLYGHRRHSAHSLLAPSPTRGLLEVVDPSIDENLPAPTMPSSSSSLSHSTHSRQKKRHWMLGSGSQDARRISACP